MIQIQGGGQQLGSNYKRIVNISSGNNQSQVAGLNKAYKSKRKSHAAETRVTLNHSMLPNHNV